ncbi:MAG: Nudix family hydrolase [Candidatus Thiodiazotropha sp.]|jgi:8-oxo-dGTP diphosphatase
MTIHVAAAAIFDAEGRVLIGRRADHLHQGGLWEFPGGKLEPGESAREALARELKEELDILPLSIEPLIRIRHAYADRRVCLDFFRVTDFAGEARGMEDQPLQWLTPWEMRPDAFPAADRPVISALRLPECYLISGQDPRHGRDFLRRLESSLRAGLRLVQLRAHQLDDLSYKAVLEEALAICRRFGARLLVNRPQQCIRWLGRADGIHLSAAQLLELNHLPRSEGLVGASCHNPRELARASSLRLDYALLSPVLATASHPGLPALGWERFAEWVDEANLPVYALGGMQSGLRDRAKAAGAQGIAAIRGFWPEA